MRVKSVLAGFVAAGLLLGQALSARAEGAGLIVVELFTSQGCSSCPPADALLNELTERHDILPLALHVDYWDYIGWADDFARPEHTARQKAYAHVAGSRTIYTPQMVVAGTEQIVGTRPMELADALMRHQSAGQPVRLTAQRANETIIVTAPALADAGRYRVDLVRFVKERKVKITRGENAGKTLRYTNIVTDWETLSAWTGAAPLALDLVLSGPEQAVVIVQEDGFGPIVGAVQLP
ncbi:DUF1223 domain-containing protein [Tropicimonas sp. TH_r6]|uniref:DUF1223 domain-containing protein n=1 Tax=Tropicimonas sp. TH_r6 TaxID=3082085 RepID=UPI0029535738|nr:DUF1223 domain-containing protein [Tropicimonas sp. TH_r6]MDV7144388.1 DUF1223 domain-containing protein [Tropicimonas sp. TH_r6]